MPANLSSLRAWRELDVPGPGRAAWDQFEPFFKQHGYKLFTVSDNIKNHFLVPAADCSDVRAEDDYARFLPECREMPPKKSVFYPQTGIHVGARSPENTDVVIRIMSIGNEGQEHLDIMRALAAPDAQVPENHTVPMLRELRMDNIVFGIFPMMFDDGMERPWFKTVREVLDALEQIFEGFAFLHERLIAHRDFSFFEVFTNYGRGFVHQPKPGACYRIPHVFRSVCPDLRYFINDFELSVQFSPESDPGTRLVTGIPIARYGGTAEQYSRHLAPEAVCEMPYCPFKADIYQLGKCASASFGNIDGVPGLQDLFLVMGSDDPNARPTAAQALASLRAIRELTPQEELDDIPTSGTGRYRRRLPDELCFCLTCSSARRDLPSRKLDLESSFSELAVT